MPELPEAEVWRRNLERWLVGRIVRDVELIEPSSVRDRWSTRPADAHPDPDPWVAATRGRAVGRVVRHGKRLAVVVGEVAWGVHLGMTGRFVHGELPRHGRVGWVVDAGTVWFADARRFGCLTPFPASELEGRLRLGHGPDALEEPLDGPGLAEACRSRSPVKVVLMDQARLAGVGNIQAVEALFHARVAPGRPASGLTTVEWARLAVELPAQLHRTIRLTDGEDVQYMTDGAHVENPFAVYGQAELPCTVCGAAIAQGRHGGRSTFWCPGCQPDRVPV